MKIKSGHNSKTYIPDPPYRILNYMRFWIWKNKCIIKFNKQSARY